MFGAYADLYGTGRVDEAFLGGGIKHRAVVVFAAVVVGVGVRVKMNQCEFAEIAGVGAQQREGNEMVAAQTQTAFAERK